MIVVLPRQWSLTIKSTDYHCLRMQTFSTHCDCVHCELVLGPTSQHHCSLCHWALRITGAATIHHHSLPLRMEEVNTNIILNEESWGWAIILLLMRIGAVGDLAIATAIILLLMRMGAAGDLAIATLENNGYFQHSLWLSTANWSWGPPAQHCHCWAQRIPAGGGTTTIMTPFFHWEWRRWALIWPQRCGYDYDPDPAIDIETWVIHGKYRYDDATAMPSCCPRPASQLLFQIQDNCHHS